MLLCVGDVPVRLMVKVELNESSEFIWVRKRKHYPSSERHYCGKRKSSRVMKQADTVVRRKVMYFFDLWYDIKFRGVPST